MENVVYTHHNLQACCVDKLKQLDASRKGNLEKSGIHSKPSLADLVGKLPLPEARKVLASLGAKPPEKNEATKRKSYRIMCCNHAACHFGTRDDLGPPKVPKKEEPQVIEGGFWCWMAFMMEGGFSGTQKQKIEKAMAAAKEKLTAKKDELEENDWESLPPKTKASFEHWFGTTDERARKKILGAVKQSLKDLNQLGAENFLEIKCDDCRTDSVLAKAHVYSDDKYKTIYLYKSLDKYGDEELTSLVVHEVSHFDTNMDDIDSVVCLPGDVKKKIEEMTGKPYQDVKPEDVPKKIIDAINKKKKKEGDFEDNLGCYGDEDNADLAEKMPGEAINNASNFESYVMDPLLGLPD